MTVSFLYLCPCLLQDVPLLSAPVQMTHPALASVQLSKSAAMPRENIPSLLTLNYGNTYTANGMIQEMGYEESRERDIYFAALEEHAQYGGMTDIALPDMFLYQYYSQVSYLYRIHQSLFCTWFFH